MLDRLPSAEEMTFLVGQSLHDVWNKLCTLYNSATEIKKCFSESFIIHSDRMKEVID
ncbi:MAG: hypothetical protein HFG28_05915 [Eubacterium sp.]|nr:hypothetical protein [Eubacterium sp.]